MSLDRDKKGAGKRTSDIIKRLDSLRKDATTTVCFRMDPRDADRLQAIADQKGLKRSQLIKSWVIEKMNS